MEEKEERKRERREDGEKEGKKEGEEETKGKLKHNVELAEQKNYSKHSFTTCYILRLPQVQSPNKRQPSTQATICMA